jgi:integrase/recombinase XerD
MRRPVAAWFDRPALFLQTHYGPADRVGFRLTKKPRKLPTVLTKEQVWKIISIPKNIKHRLILMTTYAAGLRVGEVRRLKPEHIDSQRMLIKVVGGKGRKDRYTMLSKMLLEELRRYYQACHPQNLPVPIGD